MADDSNDGFEHVQWVLAESRQFFGVIVRSSGLYGFYLMLFYLEGRVVESCVVR